MRAVQPAVVMAYDTGGAGSGTSSVAPAAGRVGFFGKMPDRGDFVRRDLPNGFVDAWDAWLQHGIAASRGTLGDAWLDAWLCAPIWRFAVPAGTCGSDAWAGVMMPSVDRAGRYFPLTLTAMAPPGLPPVAMLAGDWIAALEAVALSALDEGCNFDRFADSVASLPAFPAVRVAARDGGWNARGRMGDPAAVTLALGAACAPLLAGQCVFATRGGGRVAPAAWVLPHLPAHRAFINLIDDQQAGGVPMAAAAVPGGMAVPLAIGGAVGVAALPTADTELGHAASLFGSEFATHEGPAVIGEPPGGMFDQMLDGLAPGPSAPAAFDVAGRGPADVTAEAGLPPLPAWGLPAAGAEPAASSSGAFESADQEGAVPAAAPASAQAPAWGAPSAAAEPGSSPSLAFGSPDPDVASAAAAAGPAAVPSWGMASPGPEPAPPPAAALWGAPADLPPIGVEAPVPNSSGPLWAAPATPSPDAEAGVTPAAPTGTGAPAGPAAGAGPAGIGPQAHEGDVKLSPKDLFGDVPDDVPPGPSGGLFDRMDGRGSA